MDRNFYPICPKSDINDDISMNFDHFTKKITDICQIQYYNIPVIFEFYLMLVSDQCMLMSVALSTIQASQRLLYLRQTLITIVLCITGELRAGVRRSAGVAETRVRRHTGAEPDQMDPSESRRRRIETIVQTDVPAVEAGRQTHPRAARLGFVF